MIINSVSNTQFKGYDAIPLKALYMQGLKLRGEINIFREMKGVAQKEGLDIFLNQDGFKLVDNPSVDSRFGQHMSIWGQDNKAFIINKKGKAVLWSSKDPSITSAGWSPLEEFRIDEKKYLPRGGNYFIGYKPNGEKWLLINGYALQEKGNAERFQDLPPEEILYDLFDVKPENVYKLNHISDDLDEFVRPIGFPYVLVNDYSLSLENVEKIKNKFPKSCDIYFELKNYITNRMKDEKSIQDFTDTENICKTLSEYGFKPIRIGGRYAPDINYMNAIAFVNNKNGLSYITNSTKKSYQELLYLEKIFEENLRSKVPNITDTYFISGGKRLDSEKNSDSSYALYGIGFKNRNVIMDILANRLGGIHCMTAEVPDFEHINHQMNVIV